MRRTGNMVRMDFEFIEDAFNYIVDVDPNDKESKLCSQMFIEAHLMY